jgi:hypothetical protein
MGCTKLGVRVGVRARGFSKCWIELSQALELSCAPCTTPDIIELHPFRPYCTQPATAVSTFSDPAAAGSLRNEAQPQEAAPRNRGMPVTLFLSRGFRATYCAVTRR